MIQPSDIPPDAMISARAAYDASPIKVVGDLEAGAFVRVIARAIMAERERCAEVAETHFPQVPSYAADIAAAIRKGDAA